MRDIVCRAAVASRSFGMLMSAAVFGSEANNASMYIIENTPQS
jgi:hypothetical protein